MPACTEQDTMSSGDVDTACIARRTIGFDLRRKFSDAAVHVPYVFVEKIR